MKYIRIALGLLIEAAALLVFYISSLWRFFGEFDLSVLLLGAAIATLLMVLGAWAGNIRIFRKTTSLRAKIIFTALTFLVFPVFALVKTLIFIFSGTDTLRARHYDLMERMTVEFLAMRTGRIGDFSEAEVRYALEKNDNDVTVDIYVTVFLYTAKEGFAPETETAAVEAYLNQKMDVEALTANIETALQDAGCDLPYVIRVALHSAVEEK